MASIFPACRWSPPRRSSCRRCATVRRRRSSGSRRGSTACRAPSPRARSRPKSRYGAALQVLSEGQAQSWPRSTASSTCSPRSTSSTCTWGWRRPGPLRHRVGAGRGHAPVRPGRSASRELRPVPGRTRMRSSRRRPDEVEALGFRLLWQLVSVLGFAPSLDACVRDGTLLPEDGALPFSTREGGALCPACAGGARRHPAPGRGPRRSRGAARSRRRAAAARRASGAAHRRLLARYVRYHLGRGRGAARARVLAAPPLGGGMIIGTAGHIDHGKSALVAALTGRPMDRLAEERRRGITIDLNFAPLPLGGGRWPEWWTCPATRTSCARWWRGPRGSTSRCWSSPRTRESCRRRSSTSRCWSSLASPQAFPS